MARWGMVIDLRQCIGCEVCSITCKQSNEVPMNTWRTVYNTGMNATTDRKRISVPVHCMHCEKPSCLYVCPTTATFKRGDGIVDINYDLCIGCGYCIVACPYQVRTIMDIEMLIERPNVNDTNGQIPQGVCSKCDFCVSKIESGILRGLHPGEDTEATPECVVSCTSNAIFFGDFDDPDSKVSTLIKNHSTARIQEKQGTDPHIYYILP